MKRRSSASGPSLACFAGAVITIVACGGGNGAGAAEAPAPKPTKSLDATCNELVQRGQRCGRPITFDQCMEVERCMANIFRPDVIDRLHLCATAPACDAKCAPPPFEDLPDTPALAAHDRLCAEKTKSCAPPANVFLAEACKGGMFFRATSDARVATMNACLEKTDCVEAHRCHTAAQASCLGDLVAKYGQLVGGDH